MDRMFYEESSWKLNRATHTLTVGKPGQEYSLVMNQGVGFDVLVKSAARVFYEVANANYKDGRYFYTEKLFDQIDDSSLEPEERKRLKDQIGAVAAVQATYQGGHPEFTQKCMGVMRLDALGLEFASPSDSHCCLRIGYEKLVDILEPRKGEFSDLHIKQAQSKKATADFLGAAIGILGVVSDHHDMASIGRGFTAGIGKGAALGPAPNNRLCIVITDEGSKHRLLFDVFAATREKMEEQAHAFWSCSAKVRSRFSRSAVSVSKNAARPPTPVSSHQDALQQLQGLLKLGVLTQEEFDQKKMMLLAKTPASRTTQSTEKDNALVPIIVACPKCGIKLRTKRPGIVQCLKCHTKIRVDESRFKR